MDDYTRRLAAVQAQSMFTDLMSAAGLPSSQIALQVMFYLPQDFTRAYEELWYRAFAGKDDGGTNARGQADAEAGRLGKAAAPTSGGAAKRKTFKKYWVVADENAVDLKAKVDKRLRAIAREIDGGLTESHTSPRCPKCGKLAQWEWSYCPYDQEPLGT